MLTKHINGVRRPGRPVVSPVTLLTLCLTLWLAWSGRQAHADAVCASWPDGVVCQPLNRCFGPGACKGGDCVSTTFIPSGTVCGTPIDACHEDYLCDGAGDCLVGPLRPAGSFCGSSPDPCSSNQVCNAVGQCVAGVGLPAGTVCGPTTNPCLTDDICNANGVCVKGTNLPAGTLCKSPSICQKAGSCDDNGTCQPGANINEGTPCVGTDVCANSQCMSGACVGMSERDCSNGNPCLSRACTLGVGCQAINLCAPDMPPGDMAEDMSLSGPRDAGTNADAGKDGGVPGYTDQHYPLPLDFTGGACNCQMGRPGGPAPIGLAGIVVLGALLLRRRRAR